MLLESCQARALCASCVSASTNGSRGSGVTGNSPSSVLAVSSRSGGRFGLKRASHEAIYRSLEWTVVRESRSWPRELRKTRRADCEVADERGSVSMKLAVEKDGYEDDTHLPDVPELDELHSAQKAGRVAKGYGRDGNVEIRVEKVSNNSRKIVAKIGIGAPLEVVWGILTDYEHLADFIPGLAVSKLLEKRSDGARIFQVGEQNIALGFTFKAKAVVDCVEKPVDVQEKTVRRDIDFNTVEGDFQVFRGTWRMEQRVEHGQEESVGEKVSPTESSEAVTYLSYILTVQPKMWLPVALVEGKLTTEIKSNLRSIRDKSLQP